jgi:hypothetical protein
MLTPALFVWAWCQIFLAINSRVTRPGFQQSMNEEIWCSYLTTDQILHLNLHSWVDQASLKHRKHPFRIKGICNKCDCTGQIKSMCNKCDCTVHKHGHRDLDSQSRSLQSSYLILYRLIHAHTGWLAVKLQVHSHNWKHLSLKFGLGSCQIFSGSKLPPKSVETSQIITHRKFTYWRPWNTPTGRVVIML